MDTYGLAVWFLLPRGSNAGKAFHEPRWLILGDFYEWRLPWRPEAGVRIPRRRWRRPVKRRHIGGEPELPTQLHDGDYRRLAVAADPQPHGCVSIPTAGLERNRAPEYI